MKKVFAALFIAFVSIVLMSHNTFAVGLNLNVRYVRSHVGTISANLPSSCRSTATGGIQGTSNDCMFSGPTVATGFGEYLAGDIIEIDFIFLIVAVNDSIDAWAYDIKPVSLGDNTNIVYLGQSFEQLNGSEGMMKYYIRVNSYSNNTYGVSFTGNIHLYNNEYLNAMVTTWRVDNVDFSTINNNLQSVVDAIEESASSNTEYQEHVEEATNNAVQESQDAGQDSSDAATAGTGSLISAIGSAVAAITSASPTNCLINGNMGNLNVGQIDLCANPVPAFVTIIGSLLLVLFIVPLCISLFNRFINLFRSFQS